ncbi:MAG: hypothetical protein ILO68_00100 [Clostridia bacterium]|nr:hypothetical protein [Clostridia bacterium]
MTEIRRCFFAVATGSSAYYYIVKMPDGSEGFLKTAGNYEDQILTKPPENESDRSDGTDYWLTLKGMSIRMPDSAAGTAEEQVRFWEKITFLPSYLESAGRNVQSAYAPFSGKTALDIDYKQTTKDNPACLWVNIACGVFFVWLVALLLAERFAGSGRGRKQNRDSDKNEKE